MLLAVTIFGTNAALAQCSPDVVAPSLVCTGAYTLVLDGNGQGSVSLSDVVSSVSDNCGNPTVTLTNNSFDCSHAGTTEMLTVTATDGAGLSSSCMVSISIVDGTAPDLVVPASATFECVLPAIMAMATATDACGILAPGVTSTDGPPSSPAVPYSFTRTFSVTDLYNNTSTGTQLITVTDTGLPTITLSPASYPLSQNVACDGLVAGPMVSATDACAGSLPVAVSTSSTQGSNTAVAAYYNYTVTRTYTADDGAGNTASISTEVVYSDSEEPMFTSGLSTSGTISTSGTNPAGPCYSAFSADYSSDVTDNCASLSDLSASYMIIDQSNNSVAYSGNGLTISENLPTGSYEVLFTVLDPTNNTGSFSYMLTVDDGNAPDAICKFATQLSIGNDGTATLTTAQVDDGSYDDCGPVSLSLSRTLFDCGDIGGTIPVVLTVTDGAGNSSQCTTLILVVDNSNPAAFCQDISRVLDASGTTTVTAQDIAASPISSFDLCGLTTGLVSEDGVNFFPSVDLDCSDGASATLTLQITDGAGNTNTCTSVVSLSDTEAPVASCTNLSHLLTVAGGYELTVADSMAIVAGSSDNCSIESVTFSRSAFTCDDLDQSELASNASDTVQIHVTVYDAAGNSDMCTAILTLEELTAPAISCIDQTLSLDANGDLTVAAADLLAGNLYLSTPADDSLTTASFTASNAYDLSFDYSANSMDPAFDFGYILGGVITSLESGNTGGPATGSVTVNLNAGQTIAFYTEAKDMVAGGQGGSAWVSDLGTSIGTTIPASAISFAGNGVAFYADACGPLTVEVGPIGGPYAATMDFDCSDLTTMANPAMDVELMVTDQAGNASLCTSSITITDEAAPQVVCVFQTVDLNQTGSATLLASSFDNGSSADACGGPLAFTFVDAFGVDLGATLVMDCDSIGSRDIYIAAEDQSGNIGYCQTMAMVNDNLGPQISAPANLTQDCSESLDPSNTGLAAAVDNCDGAVAVTYTDQTVSGSSRNCRTIRRRFSAIDSRGNISFSFQDITIEDNTAPVFESDPMAAGYINSFPAIAECDIPTVVTPSIMDNCDDNVTAVVLDTTDTRIVMGAYIVTPSDAGFYNFDISRNWTATDSCGNSASRSQYQRVRDTEAPVFDASIQTTNQIAMDAGSCLATVSFDLSGLISDACADAAELTVSNNAPMGDGEYLAEGSYPAGMHSVTYFAADPVGNSNSITINFEVKDMANPVATCNSGINLSLNNQGIATLSVSQLDNGSSDNCGIASYQLSQSNFTCADIGFKRITLTVTDHAGNIATCTTGVVISETNAPVFSMTPANVVVDCGDDLSDPSIVGFAEALTSCGTAATITTADVTTSGTVDNCRTIARTHTATSPSGLTTTYVQQITVEDNSAPTYDNAPLVADRTMTFECTPGVLPVITASDDCGVQPLVSTSNDINTQATNPALFDYYNYQIGRTYTATDGCNTASSVVILYTIEDTTDPVVNVSSQTIATDMGTCQGTINIDLEALTTDCADAEYITFTNDADVQYGIGNGTNLITGVLAAGDYVINYTAEDPSGNDVSGTFTITIEDQQAPNAICDNVIVSLVSGVATITASDINEGSTDNCSAQGDLIYSLDRTSFTAPGDYPVVLTVTDEEGNTSTCNSTVTVLAPLTVTAGSASGITGSTVQLGINAMNFVNVNGLSGTISLATLPVADFVNNITYNPIFDPADWAVLVNDDVLTFTYTGTSQVNLPATGANLFMVDVELDGAIGDMTDVIVDGSSTQFTAVQNISGTNVVLTPATGTPGVITVIGNGTTATISGTLSTANGTAIALADVGYLGASSGTMTTGAAGTFSYTVPLGGNTTVAPTKDINYSNGVDIIDLADLRQHVLTNPAKQINDAYNRIAADVAPDGNINILDIIEVQQTVLDPINYEFTSNTSWRFVADGQTLAFTPNSTDVPTYDQSSTYTNIWANVSGVDFTGVKIGDINRTANAASITNGGVLQGRTSNTLEFIAQDQALVAGETYEVELRTRDFNEVLGYQFTMTLDGAIAELDDVQPGVLAGMSASNFNLASAELLTHVWDNATEVDYVDGETVFTLTMTATENGMLSQVLAMNSDLTPAIAYGQDRSQWNVALVFEQVSSTSSVLGESFSLSQNRPNPYSGNTQIDFTLPSADDVTFNVFDVNGRVVLSRSINGVTGKQTIELQASELPAAGVYHYQLITSGGAATKSMLLTK